MNEIQALPFIGIDDLQVGVFVHLEVGWLSHPFPRSGFRITSQSQIATLRSLGLTQVKWNPQLSDVQFQASSPNSIPCSPEPAPPEVTELLSPSAWTGTPPLPEPLSLDVQLKAQNQVLQACEQQFAQATTNFRQLSDLSSKDPVAAAKLAHDVSRNLIHQMLGEEELCIRLLTQASGDKVSAHAVNVTLLSLLLARSMGWGTHELTEMGVGALFHDIGKLDVPDWLRHSETHFCPSEKKGYEDHVANGVARAQKMGLSSIATMVIAQHHELSDAGGFPLRLKEDQISVSARVVALVNCYDNLCNPHMISRAITPHEAVAQIYAQQSSHFDAVILAAFIKMMGVYPAGSIVQLNDERYALVVGVPSNRPLRPRLQVYDPRVQHNDSLILDLVNHPELSIRRSCKPHTLAPDVLGYLSPHQRVAYYFEPVRAFAQPTPRFS